MPKFNTRGDILAGGGGERGSLNFAYWSFPTTGGGCWFDDDHALLQLTDPPRLALVDILTKTGESLQPERGANSFSAGGGKFLAHLAGTGVYGDVPSVLPAAGLPNNGVGRDGTRVYTPDALFGYGLHGINPDGTTFDIPEAVPDDVQIFGPSCLIWKGGAFGRAKPRPALSDISGLLLVSYIGEDWLLYWSNSAGLILQRDGSDSGWVLDTRDMEFGRDIIVLNDAIRIVWSITSGERPEDIVVLKVRGDSVTYLRYAVGWAPQTPVWKRLDAPIDPPIDPPDPPIDPPDPPIKPPIMPPKPRPYPVVRGVHMQTERGWFIGPGDKAFAIAADGKVTFERTELAEQDLLEAVPDPGGRCVVRSVQHPEFAAGADATGFNPSGNPSLEYYATRNAPGNYELWSFGQWPSGIVQGTIEYIDQGANNGRHFQAAGLTWVKQS